MGKCQVGGKSFREKGDIWGRVNLGLAMCKPSFVGEGSPLPKSAKIEDSIRLFGIVGGETPPLRPTKTHR